MRAVLKQSVYNVITAMAVSGTLLIMIILLTQNRTLSKGIQEQTTINQRYLRCILLLPTQAFDTIETRVVAIDRCAEESRLPGGQELGGQR